jgi:hypothetical protein
MKLTLIHGKDMIIIGVLISIHTLSGKFIEAGKRSRLFHGDSHITTNPAENMKYIRN